MPIFEYTCETCGHCFEQMIFSIQEETDGETAPSCPACGGKNVQRLLSAGNFRPQGIASGKGGFAPPKCARKGS